MSVKKLSELTYQDQKIKIGNSTLDAINGISHSKNQKTPVNEEVNPEVSKPEIDLEQLKILYAKEIEVIELEAKTKGEKEGFDKGIEKAKEDAKKAYKEKQSELQKQLVTLKKIEEALLEKQEQTLESEQSLLLEVIFTIICKLVTNPKFYEELISKTINDISIKNKDQSIAISIHPDDAKLIEQLNLTEQLTNLTIYEDNTLDCGGVYIESDDRTVDARLETVLLNTKKLLQTRNND